MRLVYLSKLKNPIACDAFVRTAAVLAMFFYSASAFSQKPEYEFYYQFRADFSPTLQEASRWSLTDEQIFEKYAAKLKEDCIAWNTTPWRPITGVVTTSTLIPISTTHRTPS